MGINEDTQEPEDMCSKCLGIVAKSMDDSNTVDDLLDSAEELMPLPLEGDDNGC